MQRIVPYLTYRDAPAALTFLSKAFGFTEKMRYPMDDGRIGHAETGYQENIVMLASEYEGFGISPLALEQTHTMIHCIVDDVDAHFARARAGGATIVAEPANEHGQRRYRALDPEGHKWIFAQQLEP